MLHNSTIRLRAPEPEDLAFLYQWENDPDTWRLGSTLTPLSRYTLKRYIQIAHRDIWEVKQLRLIIERTARAIPVGTIDLFDFDPFHMRAGVGILIACPTNRRQGLASQALGLLIDYSFRTLGLHQLYCNISAQNTPSLSLFKKHGFLEIGVKREWIRTGQGWADEVMLQRLQ